MKLYLSQKGCGDGCLSQKILRWTIEKGIEQLRIPGWSPRCFER